MNTILKGSNISITRLMQINRDIFVYLKVYLRLFIYIFSTFEVKSILSIIYFLISLLIKVYNFI